MFHRFSAGIRAVTAAVATAALAGCVSYSAMQTARTLKPGKAVYALSAGYETLAAEVPGPSADGNTTVQTLKTLHLPVLEYGIRYGLRDGLDGGIRSNVLGSTLGDLKVRIVDTGRYAFSGGLGLGYSQINVGTGDYASKITAKEVQVPAYNSLVLSPSLEIYATPRYVYRLVSGVGADSLVGASAGVILGRATALAFELSVYQDIGNSTQVIQVMVGVLFGEDNEGRMGEKGAKKKKAKDGG